MDIFVPTQSDICAVTELNMVSNGIIRCERDCDDLGGFLGGLWDPGFDVLWYKYQIRLRICTDGTGSNGGAGVQIEATGRAGKLDEKREDTILKVRVDRINGGSALSNLLCGLMDQDWNDIFDLANALVGG